MASYNKLVSNDLDSLVRSSSPMGVAHATPMTSFASAAGNGNAINNHQKEGDENSNEENHHDHRNHNGGNGEDDDDDNDSNHSVDMASIASSQDYQTRPAENGELTRCVIAMARCIDKRRVPRWCCLAIGVFIGIIITVISSRWYYASPKDFDDYHPRPSLPHVPSHNNDDHVAGHLSSTGRSSSSSTATPTPISSVTMSPHPGIPVPVPSSSSTGHWRPSSHLSSSTGPMIHLKSSSTGHASTGHISSTGPTHVSSSSSSLSLSSTGIQDIGNTSKVYVRPPGSYQMSERFVAVPTMYWGLNNQVLHLEELVHAATTENMIMCYPHIAIAFESGPLIGVERPFGYLFDRAHFQQCTSEKYGLRLPISIPDIELCQYLVDTHKRLGDAPGYNPDYPWPDSARAVFGDVNKFTVRYRQDFGRIQPSRRYNGDQFRAAFAQGKRVITATSLFEQFDLHYNGYGDKQMYLFTDGCLRGNPPLMALSQAVRDGVERERQQLLQFHEVTATTSNSSSTSATTGVNATTTAATVVATTTTTERDQVLQQWLSRPLVNNKINVIGLHLRAEKDLPCAPNAQYIIDHFCDRFHVSCESSILVVATSIPRNDFVLPFEKRFLRILHKGDFVTSEQLSIYQREELALLDLFAVSNWDFFIGCRSSTLSMSGWALTPNGHRLAYGTLRDWNPDNCYPGNTEWIKQNNLTIGCHLEHEGHRNLP